ncbi:ABC transporter [Vandammella animalimorsus]|uniref:ABC transporter n=1 Tax=Vandammella animalimorsus TaxID=2029117 RepID=A0A2A2AFR5_9BURK|nr:ABC transporter permease subunit [Vandammella animalimorsus]PAT31193.1 ABC transporter [Vandammella animalimorsus]PAT36613.1 ABC transporter [Vandammella animalimorsus]PAT41836.1 ABC transporter [Vandammella animalimorsus]PAX16156.1 ABC transporter [Vandammella animalimorsus]PAX18186.1 ABC transporter [Vandammella animalimorsus]
MTGYYLSILQGALLTVALSLASLLVAIVLGLLGAGAKLSRNRLAMALGQIYTTVVRGVPELLLLLLVFYGGTTLLNMLLERLGYTQGISINPFMAGVLTIGFIYGAYMTENFRGAIKAIPIGQREAALAFGMQRWQVFRRITLPQMIRYVVPSFTNSWMALIKATALVSLINLQDMTYLATQAGRATREPFLFILLVAGIYLLFTSLSLWVLRKIHARYSLGSETISL